MPFDSNGNYSLPNGYLAVSGQTILASQHNPPLQDIAAALSQVVLRSGVAPMNGNLSMAGFKITNAAVGVADGDYVTMAQLNDVIASVTSSTVPTGAVQGFRRTTPPTGWIKENGGTIGSAASGATNRANADTEELFTLLWEQFNNTILPIQTSAGAVTTRGASAAADFAAAKRMPLFDARSRFLRGADDGLGYDSALTVGATQDDALQNITGRFTSIRRADNGEIIDGHVGAFKDGGTTTVANTVQNTAPTLPARITTFDASLIARTATETRPRSSVLLYCIKL